MFRRAAIIATIVAAVGAIVYLLSPNPPAIVSELRALPQVAHVRYAGPANAALTVVHVRDFHIVPEEQAKLEELDFPALMDAVEKVQADQREIVRHLIARHGTKAVYSEGLSKDSMDGLHLRVNVLKAVQAQVEQGKFNADEKGRYREMTLTVGTVGRLLMGKEIGEVLPLEDEEALQAANPVKDGVVRRDEAKIAARQKAMVDAP